MVKICKCTQIPPKASRAAKSASNTGVFGTSCVRAVISRPADSKPSAVFFGNPHCSGMASRAYSPEACATVIRQRKNKIIAHICNKAAPDCVTVSTSVFACRRWRETVGKLGSFKNRQAIINRLKFASKIDPNSSQQPDVPA